jgi:hypothetical protein
VGLAIALALHVLGFAALMLWGQPPSSSAATQPAQPPSEAALIWVERADAPAPVEPPAPAALEPPSGAERQRLARAVSPRSSSPASSEDPSTVGSGDGEDSVGSGGGEEQAETPAEPPAAAGAKHLSLDQLAVGPGHNPFLAPSAQRPSSARALGRRLDHVLRSGLAEHDRQLGLGPEGPAIAAITDLVMQSTTAPNTEASLVLRTDGAGETIYVEVTEASGDTAAWNTIAQSLLRALHGKKLRVPHGSGGVTMQLRVVSRVQLPSGADPGLAIDLFGKEIKAGAGDRSTRIELLTPKIIVQQVPIAGSDDPRATIPVIGLGLTIFGVMGDPVDIASTARRVVHARLVSLETHPDDSE